MLLIESAISFKVDCSCPDMLTLALFRVIVPSRMSVLLLFNKLLMRVVASCKFDVNYKNEYYFKSDACCIKEPDIGLSPKLDIIYIIYLKII